MDFFQRKNSLSLGARGEQAAAAYLKSSGYQILAANFCNTSGRRLGEIDIIAQDGGEIVFVEVKTRTNSTSGRILPEENITRSKLYKLNKAASFYISKNKLYDSAYRFDAITLVVNQNGSSASLKHIKNIFF